MRQEAIRLAAARQDPTQSLNILREYLQGFILRSLHESEAFRCLSFVGGTALRFLYDMHRFSEDLDFSLERSEGYDAELWLRKLKRELAFAAFDAEITWNNRKTVHSGWIRFSGLLHELGLAAHPNQKMSVKLEIDTRPPSGARLETRILNRHFLVAVRHHDLPSLMAGKIHALWSRGYPKGRDWYDLVWYLSRGVRPNTILLENALEQTGHIEDWKHPWPVMLTAKTKDAPWEKIVADVKPFLENPGEASLLTAENMLSMLAQVE